MGIVNMLLSLPAGRQMLALPKEQSEPLAAVMRQLREQANTKAAAAQARGDESLMEYWRLVSTYAKYVARAFNRENLKREKSKVNGDLIRAMSGDSRETPADNCRYVGVNAFRLPPITEQRCILEVVHVSFAPWVEVGDFVKVDFTVQRLTADGLYLVAVDGKDLAIRGFHKARADWYVHESSGGVPRIAHMLEDRLPAGFEIVGLVSDVFKKNALKGDA